MVPGPNQVPATPQVVPAANLELLGSWDREMTSRALTRLGAKA